MPEWTTACPDWEQRIVEGRPLIALEPLFPDQADKAMAVFGELRMVDAPGSPRMAETVRPWAVDFVRAVFGAYDGDSGRRLIRDFLLLVSKKNGKSSIAAGVMLTALILNWRHSGEYIILAPTKEVADNSYKPIRDMIAADEELSAMLHVQTHLRMVTHRETQATLKVVAADSETVSGKKAIGVFVDELHEFGKQAKAENMLLEATGGLASRPEGFVIYATTQSADPPAGVFRQKLQFARRVRDGKTEAPSFLPVLYEFPEWMLRENKHREFENAYVTNPNWGLSVDEEFIRERHRESLDAGEEAFRLFLAKHLNVEIGLALRADRWRGADWWEQAAERGLTLERVIERSEVLCIGIDGGGLDDLLGLAVLGREIDTGRWLHWGKAWAHKSVLQLRKSEAPLLLDLKRDGDLVLVEEVGDDLEQVADIVEQCDSTGLLSGVGCDPAGIGALVDAIVGRGIDQERLIAISQGWRLVGAIKTCERKLAEHKFAHGGTKLMAWSVGNARIEPRGNAVLITKQASGTGKIDPLMATLNATELMSRNPQALGYYAAGGQLVTL